MSSYPTTQRRIATLEAEAARFAKLAQFEFSPLQARHLRATSAALMDEAAKVRLADLTAAARRQLTAEECWL